MGTVALVTNEEVDATDQRDDDDETACKEVQLTLINQAFSKKSGNFNIFT